MPANDDPILPEYWGAIEPVWTSDTPVDADTRRYINVPQTSLYGDPLYGKPRGVKFDQGLVGWVRASLFSAATGAPLVVDIGGYSTDPSIDVRIVEASGVDPRVYEPDAPAELAADGASIAFEVPPEVSNVSGVYRAQMRVVDGNGVERCRDEFWLYVDRGFWTTDGSVPTDSGPPTFAEIRTSLRDHPAANRLLGDYEYDPAEIGWGVVSAVQRFNNELPPLPRNYLLTTTNIPGEWRRQILNGSLSYLMETAASYFRRGHLPYAAGNLAIDDLAKDKEYQQACRELREDFVRWIRLARTAISISGSHGSVSSGHPNAIR